QNLVPWSAAPQDAHTTTVCESAGPMAGEMGADGTTIGGTETALAAAGEGAVQGCAVAAGRTGMADGSGAEPETAFFSEDSNFRLQTIAPTATTMMKIRRARCASGLMSISLVTQKPMRANTITTARIPSRVDFFMTRYSPKSSAYLCAALATELRSRLKLR